MIGLYQTDALATWTCSLRRCHHTWWVVDLWQSITNWQSIIKASTLMNLILKKGFLISFCCFRPTFVHYNTVSLLNVVQRGSTKAAVNYSFEVKAWLFSLPCNNFFVWIKQLSLLNSLNYWTRFLSSGLKLLQRGPIMLISSYIYFIRGL